MPAGNDKIYYGGTLKAVTIFGENLYKKRLLSFSGEFYAANTGFWQKAMAYMRNIGDRKGEQEIWMKRFNYNRAQSAKYVLGGMAATVGAVFVAAYAAPAIITATPSAAVLGSRLVGLGRVVSNIYRVTLIPRVAINVGTQALLDDEHFNGINVVSVMSEFIPVGFSGTRLLGLGMTTVTPAVEWKPFSKDEKFRAICGYGKTTSEFIFDASVQGLTTAANRGASDFVRSQLKSPAMTQLENRMMNLLVFPTVHTGYQLSTQGMSNSIKGKVNFKDNGEVD